MVTYLLLFSVIAFDLSGFAFDWLVCYASCVCFVCCCLFYCLALISCVSLLWFCVYCYSCLLCRFVVVDFGLVCLLCVASRFVYCFVCFCFAHFAWVVLYRSYHCLFFLVAWLSVFVCYLRFCCVVAFVCLSLVLLCCCDFGFAFLVCLFRFICVVVISRVCFVVVCILWFVCVVLLFDFVFVFICVYVGFRLCLVCIGFYFGFLFSVVL